MIKKIYKVYNGELFVIDVIKETEKMVFVNSPRELGFSSRLYKDAVFVTPAEAIQEEKRQALEHVRIHREGLKRANKRLVRVEEIELEHFPVAD